MKKIISLILAIIILGTSVFAQGRSTSPSEWAVENVSRAKALGILEEGKVYNYTEAITREEFCELAFNVLVLCEGDCKCNGINPFSDVNNRAVSKLYGHGIIKGKSETEFAPNDLLTREEAAVILDRICNEVGVVGVGNSAGQRMFYDHVDFSDWSINSIFNITNFHIMEGVGDNNFSPKGTYTTEQAITTLVRLYDCYKNINSENIEYNNFADKLSSQMPVNENYMISPLSIKMALAMAANGTDGETKEEILKALDIENLDEFNTHSKEMIKKYSEQDLVKLDIANSIWINTDRTIARFSNVYFNTVRDFYNAEARNVTDAEALGEINGWVSDKTKGKITQIIEDTEFEAMLINAIYFKGFWLDKFDEDLTKPDTFYNIDETESEIDFMNKTDYFNYCSTGDVQIVEIPYNNVSITIDEEGNVTNVERYDDLQVSMYVMLSGNNVAPVEELKKAKEEKKFTSEKVFLSLPKFEIEFEEELKEELENIGIVKAFSTKAEFANMFEIPYAMLIDNVLHKTYINVNEKETEAAAVTAIGVDSAGMPRPEEPIRFKADRPFTFIIRDNANGEILFMGEYVTAK